MKSGSYLIVEFLRKAPYDYTFDSFSLQEELKEHNLSHGTVTGTITRLERNGAIAVVKREARQNGRMGNIYQVVDLSEFRVKETRPKEHTVNRTNAKGTTNRQRVAALLRTLAEEVETMRGSIEDYSTSEIIKELGKRTHD